MVLFLLPFIFNPFGLAFSWLPFLYLSTWPLIVQTSGRDILMTHAVVLMLFVLTCDVTRRLMLKFIGFDLISLPAGVALLIALATDKGSALLSLFRPLFGGLLSFIEPFFLLLELYIFLGIIKKFNRWLSELANVRDEESQDLSNWEPPLTRGSLTVRAVVILLTLLSYVGVYVIIQGSKSFLSDDGEEIPLTFNHAIAALVTLQLIAISLTIYKEDGILSESAMVALLATVPIFIASLSYYHAKQTHLSSSSSWTSYFPFSSFLFGSSSSSSSSQEDQRGFDFDGMPTRVGHLDSVVGDPSELLLSSGSLSFGRGRHVDFGQVESSLLDGLLLDNQSKKLLSAPLKQLIMIINSILGLSVDKIAKYYFSPDFWYILLGRALCIGLWTMGSRRRGSDFFASSGPDSASQRDPQEMLIQQIDNQTHLVQDLQAANSLTSPSSAVLQSCCGGANMAAPASSNKMPPEKDEEDSSSQLTDWFNCMWTSAKACSGGGGGASSPSMTNSEKIKPMIGRLFASLFDFCNQIFDSIVLFAMLVAQKLASIHLLIHSVGAVWIARWRSPIVHRLLQSILVQVLYIGSLLVSNGDDDDKDDWQANSSSS